jgi:hypothetical protein
MPRLSIEITRDQHRAVRKKAKRAKLKIKQFVLRELKID